MRGEGSGKGVRPPVLACLLPASVPSLLRCCVSRCVVLRPLRADTMAVSCGVSGARAGRRRVGVIELGTAGVRQTLTCLSSMRVALCPS